MKSRTVVLINPGHDDEVDPKVARSFGAMTRKVRREDPPVSILNLGGYIRDHGYDVVVVDTHVEPEYRRTIQGLLREKPLAIGFSVIIGKFAKNALGLTKMAKELAPDVPVVWGGKLVHLAGRLALERPDIDFVITGDGELPFLKLLDALREEKDYRGIPGVGYRENGRPVINENTFRVERLDDIYISRDFGWELVRKHVNRQQVPYFISLYTSRGCKFNCSFCYLKDIKELESGMRLRRRSAENIISEIGYLHENFGIDVVTFGDDDFLSEAEKIAPVFDYLRRKGIYIEHIWTNIHNLRPENIALLKGVCQTVCYSIETASPRLQRILRKRISAEKAIEVNKSLRRAGINTVHNFLFGVPTETDEETRMNIELLKKLKEVNPHMRANTYILSPIPGTPIFQYAEELAGKKMEWKLEDLADFHFRYMDGVAPKFRPYFTPEDNLHYETVSEMANELFAELNSGPTAEHLEKIGRSPRLGYIFKDIECISRPKGKTRKYILDLVLEASERGLASPAIEPF
ncbi:MAG: radical SAM protein [Thermodesulfobacteriota bacterium]|nr:MAG: radical SAM protein [Thermodesulfobacteriota bacterium]